MKLFNDINGKDEIDLVVDFDNALYRILLTWIYDRFEFLYHLY
jgi:hypothetical protein